MSQMNDPDNGVKDVKQLGLFASLASLSYVFWICGGMEMVERLAYYGVRSTSSLYATDAQSNGGLGLVGSELGSIFLVWALIQSFVPVFTGGISDRIGYKETIFASTVAKIIGYLIMALFPSYWGFMAGAAMLAFGTGIFKPGIQGTIVNATNRQNSSMAWGVFYQTVNIGAFLGPLIAAQLRVLAWENVFYVCALIISINFLLLLTYKEPNKEARLAYRAKVKAGEIVEKSLWADSLREITRPILLWYMVLFSGFWFMLMAFWDIGPLFVRDWVDTSTLVNMMFGDGGTDSKAAIFFFGMNPEGTVIKPEGMINFNAMLIMTTCFIIAGLSAKLKATNSMALGTFFASTTLILFGGFNAAWVILVAIICFSIGEMLSSPKSSEYLGNIAPAQKKAMYLGFSQLPIGIGWSVESWLGQVMYDHYGSKDRLSRVALEQGGMAADQVQAIPIGEAFDALVAEKGIDAVAVTEQLYAANDVGTVWYLFAIIGVIASVGMFAYGKWTYRLAKESA